MCDADICPDCASLVPRSMPTCPKCGCDFSFDDEDFYDFNDYELMQQAYDFGENIYE